MYFEARPKWRRPDEVLLWITFLLVFASTVTTLPQALLVASGRNPELVTFVGGGYDLGTRIIREGVNALLCVAIFWYVVLGAVRVSVYQIIGIFLFASYCAFLAFMTVAYRHLPLVLALIGYRTFQFLPLAFVGYILARRYGRELWIRFTDLILSYIFVEFVISLLETLGGFGQAWHQTVFGARAFGTFAYFNHFGAMLVLATAWISSALVIAPDPKRARGYSIGILMCIICALFSGSRTAMIGCMLVAMLPQFLSAGNTRVKLAVLAQIPTFLVLGLLIASSPELSGRTNLEHEGRIGLWEVILERVNSVGDLAFGWGLGLGTTTVVTIFGRDHFPGQLGNTHSTWLSLLSGYGLIGMVGYAIFLFGTLRRGPFNLVLAPILAAALVCTPYNVLEYFPSNVLIFFYIGAAYGLGNKLHDEKLKRAWLQTRRESAAESLAGNEHTADPQSRPA